MSEIQRDMERETRLELATPTLARWLANALKPLRGKEYSIFGAMCKGAASVGLRCGVLLVVSHAAGAAELLYRNDGCTDNTASASYQARIEPLRDAFRQGREVRVYLSRTEADGHLGEYMATITAARFDELVVSALLPMRPLIDGHANAIAAGGQFVGSIDSLGIYRYGAYKFGQTGTAPTSAACFTVSWFAQ